MIVIFNYYFYYKFLILLGTQEKMLKLDFAQDCACSAGENNAFA